MILTQHAAVRAYTGSCSLPPLGAGVLAAVGFLLLVVPLFGTAASTSSGIRADGAQRDSAPGCSPANLTATPTSGAAPLTVDFSLRVTSPTTPSYNWSFGDQAYWNGSGPLYAQPIHRYSTPGSYSVVVVVAASAGVRSCSVTISVSASPLRAVALATPSSGSAPVTVDFQAQVSGGTGTYTSVLWTFGTGDSGSGSSVRYTYPSAGHYRATLNVTDTSGASISSAVWVNLTTGPPKNVSGGPGGGLVIPLWTIAASAGGVAAAIGLGTLYRRWSYRTRAASLSSPSPPSSAVSAGSLVPLPLLDVRPAVAGPGSAALVAAAPIGPSGPHPGFGEKGSTAAAPPVIPFDTLRLSQRVIVHLSMQGALGDDAIATDAFTQGGMADSLGVPQNRLSNVLRRLRQAGVVTEDVRHVRGRPRRMKVYRLSQLGEELGRDLRRRARLTGPGGRPRT